MKQKGEPFSFRVLTFLAAAIALILMAAVFITVRAEKRVDCTSRAILTKNGIGICVNINSDTTFVYWVGTEMVSVQIAGIPEEIRGLNGRIFLSFGYFSCRATAMVGVNEIVTQVSQSADPDGVLYEVKERVFNRFMDSSKASTLRMNPRTGKTIKIWSMPTQRFSLCDYG